jgi:hypothetical protein
MSEPSVSRARLVYIFIFIKIDRESTYWNKTCQHHQPLCRQVSKPARRWGRQDRLARFTARGIPPERVTGNNSKKLPACHPKKPDISERPTHAPAPARQQLNADDKFAKILLAERILEMNMRLACFKCYLS